MFNLTHTQDNHWGATEYRVNKNGQVTDVLNALRHSEHYRYDSQLNLIQKAQRETDALGQYQFEAANDASFGMKQRNGRITRFGNKTYKYDELDRLHSKTERRKVSVQLQLITSGIAKANLLSYIAHSKARGVMSTTVLADVSPNTKFKQTSLNPIKLSICQSEQIRIIGIR